MLKVLRAEKKSTFVAYGHKVTAPFPLNIRYSDIEIVYDKPCAQ